MLNKKYLILVHFKLEHYYAIFRTRYNIVMQSLSRVGISVLFAVTIVNRDFGQMVVNYGLQNYSRQGSSLSLKISLET